MWRTKPQQPPSWGQHSPRATRRHNQDLDPRPYADTYCCSPCRAARWDYFRWQAKVRRTHPRCPPSFSSPTAFLPLGLVRSTCVSSHPALLPPKPTGPASWFTANLSAWKTQSDLSNTEVCAGFFNDFPSTPYQMNSQLLCWAWRASHSWPPAHLCSFISLCCLQSSPKRCALPPFTHFVLKTTLPLSRPQLAHRWLTPSTSENGQGPEYHPTLATNHQWNNQLKDRLLSESEPWI